MLEPKFMCEKGGQLQPALAMLSEMLLATSEGMLSFEEGELR